MPVWKLCIALIREYGFFTELKNLDFSKLAPVINKVVTIPLKEGEPIKVQYKEIDKILRTTEITPGLAVTHDKFSTSTNDPVNDKPVSR